MSEPSFSTPRPAAEPCPNAPAALVPFFFRGLEAALRLSRRANSVADLIKPWPWLAHAERIVQFQLVQLPADWSPARQNLADRLCRLLLLRFAHARIFADLQALEQCPAILLALSRVWSGEEVEEEHMAVERLVFARSW
ncbi:MAG: hypothetical protein JJ714_01120 [Acidithiobacillus sp.]|nr:hypothetical protein [Acidithiobacillus sp.]